MDFKLGELFSGPGGIALGAHLASVPSCSIKTIWANDYDQSTCDTYKANNLNVNVICKDVRTLDINALDSIDCFAFGFPCNDFSTVGEQKGINGKFGPLYTYGVNVIRKFKPKWFLAENVGGLRSANGGSSLDTILGALFDEGYDLVPHLYKFEEYSVPQARHRLIIVGIRKDLKLSYRVPAPTTANKPVTCREAIEIPRIPKDAANHELTNQSLAVIERLKFIKPGENAFTAKLPADLELNVKGAKISQIYKRLDPNRPAYTITGSGGGGTHVYHWKENRALTNRERARLQTFPDSYIFVGKKENVRKQIGMAVPPIGAKIIFEAILKTFSKIEYDSVPSSIRPMFHDALTRVKYENGCSLQLRVLEKKKNYKVTKEVS